VTPCSLVELADVSEYPDYEVSGFLWNVSLYETTWRHIYKGRSLECKVWWLFEFVGTLWPVKFFIGHKYVCSL
jgi:hypothetical protein